ncbi:hypothetical protein [Microbacterium candidum]|uniref:WXG100 family type VII secretion target n=1 Tax=Microbacterium candidum TaxID=3041922 RepID=A0ABT7MUV8_9MICO|nr:hypothetical protein [Microbacterium sp. ASV49]MDL9978213.1 hypothetical protein [Microbacterium sp. ASV49]
MDRLEVDFAELHHAKQQLATTADTLRRAQLMGDRLADLTGHPRLAGKVRDFASNWAIHRSRLLASLRHLEDSIAAIEETFADVDHRLGREVGGAIAKGTHP